MTSRPVLLALRALGLGDFATAVPALRALRRAYPDHEIALAAPAALAPLVQATGAVDRHVSTPAYVREPMERLDWTGRRPAIAVNLHGRGPQSHTALLALRPGRLLAFANPDAGFSRGPLWTPNEHEVARWCRMLACYGIPVDRDDLALPAPAPVPDRVGAIVIHPGASGPERCWPVERYAAVAAALRDAGHRVLVTGSAAEEPLAAGVAAAAELPADSVLAGRTDLAELSAVVAHARLVLCGDTGVAHLATAYHTPSVVLFGPVDPVHWGPPADRIRHVAVWHGPAGLTEITVPEVLRAAERALSAGARAGAVSAGARAGAVSAGARAGAVSAGLTFDAAAAR